MTRSMTWRAISARPDLRVSVADALQRVHQHLPGGRAIENKHATDIGRARMTYLQGERSSRPADSVRRGNIGPMIVINNPPACCPGTP